MKRFLGLISLVLVFVGLLISFLEVKGWLPNPRLELANKIMNLGENILPLNTPHADELILSFLSAEYPKLNKNNLNTTLRDIEGIVIENLILDGHDVLGSVRLQHEDGVRVKVICGFQDLKAWASDRQFVKWIGWSLAFIGAIIGLLRFLIREKARDTNWNC